MSPLQKLQNWYLAECNDDWEHTFGIRIETLDNPGWFIRIDLAETLLIDKKFEEYSLGQPTDDNSSEWIHCRVEGDQFIGTGSPLKLEAIIDIFMTWARAGS